MQIVILDDYQDTVRKLACASKLDAFQAKVYTNTIKGVGQLAVRLRDADVLVLIYNRTGITRQLLEKLPKLKLIVQIGSDVGHIDVPACTARNIAVSVGAQSPYPVAELTWALLMAACRRLPQYIANLRHGVWQQSGLKASFMPPNFGLGTMLRGKTLGIWGFGRVGKLVAQYGSAFGMQVMVWGSDRALAEANAQGYTPASSKEQLFGESDYLSLHLRASTQTHHIISLADLSLMKPTAVLLNTASADLIPTEALIAALNRGRPGMAAIDVFDNEPLMPGNTLLRLENCLCTPHIGYVEQQSYELAFSAAFDTIVNFVENKPIELINLEALRSPLG